MGLKERRGLEEFKKNRYPGIKKEIDSAAGFDVAVEVKWDTLAAEGCDHLYNDAFPKVYFTPLATALKNIASDDMGKAALRKGLKKVVISNEKGKSNPSEFVFSKGQLLIDHQPCANIGDVGERAAAIQKLLENAL